MSLLLLLWSLLGTADAARSAWDVRLVVDQSGTMFGHDPDGYALIGPAILADIAQNGDRIEFYEQGGPRRSFQLLKNKSALQKNLGGGSDWEHPLNAAVDDSIKAGSGKKRLLIMIYDGDHEDRRVKSWSTAPRLIQNGGSGMVIGIGKSASDSPKTMKMFGPDRAKYVKSGDGKALLQALADAFGFLTGSIPSTGSDRPGSITVAVDPDVDEAWLVVLADSPVGAITSTTGPHTQPPGTGWTHHNTNRSYNVVKLTRPKAGKWTFNASTSASKVDWLLLQTFSYGDLNVKVGPCAANVPCTVTASFDGKAPSKATVVATPEGGSPITLTRQPDGTYKSQATFTSPGNKTLTTVAKSGSKYRVEDRQSVNVEKATGHLLCEPGQTIVPAGGKYPFVRQQGVNHPLKQAWATIDGTRINLQRKGGGYGGRAPIPPIQGEVKVTIGSTTSAGDSAECEETWRAQPRVKLAITADPLILIGQNRLDPIWNPFTCTTDNLTVQAQDPSNDCNACGGCSGASGFAKTSGSMIEPMVPIEATIELVSPLPKHVQLFVLTDKNGKFRPLPVSTGSQTTFQLDPTQPILPTAVCGGHCPKAGTYPLTFIVRVHDVFDASSTATTTTTVEQTVTSSLEVTASDWWTCFATRIYIIIGSLIALLIVMGFVIPLKFRRQSNFPTHVRSTPAEPELMDAIGGVPQQELKRKVKRTWYQHQKIWLDTTGSLRPTKHRAATRIELRNDDGRAEAWIVPVAGQWLWHGPRHSPRDDWPDEMIEPEIGAPLKLGHLYIAFSSDEADEADQQFYCLLFEQQ